MNIRDIKRFVPDGLKPKDLIGIPWRVAFALQSDGWLLRSDIIWHKSNPMPESVTDRPTSSHEHIFLFAKSRRYFYDAEAIKEPAKSRIQKCGRNSRANADRDPAHGTRKQDAIGKGTYTGFNDRYIPSRKRNPRTVWTFATHPYKDAHFATFPPKLPEMCIRAGTSQHGVCAECGAPWKRMVRIERHFMSGSERSGNLPKEKNGTLFQGGGETVDIRRGPVLESDTLGWQPTCDCHGSMIPAIVLDPFAGAGTTLMVALRLGRRAIGIELNPEYVNLAERRILNDAPLLNGAEIWNG